MYHRNKPTASSLVYNAQACYHKNHTEAFIKKHFKSPDHNYVHAQAHYLDEQGIDRKQREAQVAHMIKIAEENAAQEAEQVAKKQKEAERMASINIVYDEVAIRGMGVKDLTDQIEKWRALNVVKDIPLKSKLKLKAEKMEELFRIHAEYQKIQEASEIVSATNPA